MGVPVLANSPPNPLILPAELPRLSPDPAAGVILSILFRLDACLIPSYDPEPDPEPDPDPLMTDPLVSFSGEDGGDREIGELTAGVLAPEPEAPRSA